MLLLSIDNIKLIVNVTPAAAFPGNVFFTVTGEIFKHTGTVCFMINYCIPSSTHSSDFILRESSRYRRVIARSIFSHAHRSHPNVNRT